MISVLQAGEVGEMDRISELPEPIVHHILSFLRWLPAELVRMSVLSKTWFHLTASFQILYFDIHNFRHVSRESFFKYVEYTTSRFCCHDVIVHRFKIVTGVMEDAELDIVNRCLELLLKKGVSKLEIDITNSSATPMTKYSLPNILLSVSALISLIIRGCELPSLMVDAVKFRSLIWLRLESVSIDEETIKCLTTSCSLLQAFELIYCLGFKRFCVYHRNLEKISIFSKIPFEKIDIEAPNLYRLRVIDYDKRGPPQMKLASCKNLKTVTYYGHPLKNSNSFTNFLSNFPFIENLVLVTKHKHNNLKLSSRSLKTLVLSSKFDLEGIEFNTPNLDLFIYSRDPWYIWRMVGHLTHLKAYMCCYPDVYIDTLWFQRLRLFLDKKNGFTALNLYIHMKQEFIVLEELNVIELPPYELEHVELHFEHEESSSHAVFVDAVLCCCRPRSLTLRSSFSLTDFEEQSDLVKFTYKKLLEQEDEGHTNIQILSPSSSKAKKQFGGLMPLLGGSPCKETTISFIKEEVVQEEALDLVVKDMWEMEIC